MKPNRGTSRMQVYLSRSETTEWADVETRAQVLAALRKQAAARGRKYLQVHDAAGVELVMVDV